MSQGGWDLGFAMTKFCSITFLFQICFAYEAKGGRDVRDHGSLFLRVTARRDERHSFLEFWRTEAARGAGGASGGESVRSRTPDGELRRRCRLSVFVGILQEICAPLYCIIYT